MSHIPCVNGVIFDRTLNGFSCSTPHMPPKSCRNVPLRNSPDIWECGFRCIHRFSSTLTPLLGGTAFLVRSLIIFSFPVLRSVSWRTLSWKLRVDFNARLYPFSILVWVPVYTYYVYSDIASPSESCNILNKCWSPHKCHWTGFLGAFEGRTVDHDISFSLASPPNYS